MTVNEYLEEHNLDYNDVILKDVNGNKLIPATLIQYCTVISVNGNELVIK